MSYQGTTIRLPNSLGNLNEYKLAKLEAHRVFITLFNGVSEGIQKVVIDFPKFTSEDLVPGIEGWLVFQLRESYILANNCTQVKKCSNVSLLGSQLFSKV